MVKREVEKWTARISRIPIMNAVEIPSAAVMLTMAKECVRDILAAKIGIMTKNGLAPAKDVIRNDDDFVFNTCLFHKLN